MAVFDISAQETNRMKYPIPGHGYLQMDIPAEWYARFHERSRYPYPLIIMYAHESQPAFQLSISVFWDDRPGFDVTSSEYIRTMLDDIGDGLLPSSQETRLDLQPIFGQMGKGFYFDLTDASESGGEFPFLRQGAISVGDLLLAYAIFYTDKESTEVIKLNKLLENSIQINRGHVNWHQR